MFNPLHYTEVQINYSTSAIIVVTMKHMDNFCNKKKKLTLFAVSKDEWNTMVTNEETYYSMPKSTSK